MQLTTFSKSPSMSSTVEGFETEKYKADLDFVLSECDTVQHSVQETKQFWGRCVSVRTEINQHLDRILSQTRHRLPPLRGSKTLKKTVSKNLLASPQKFTFDAFSSDHVSKMLNRTKRSFGKKATDTYNSEINSEVTRKRKVFIERVSLDPTCKVPPEFLDDNYVKKFDFSDFKTAIELNRKQSNTRNFEYKHLRTDKNFAHSCSKRTIR